MSSHDDLGIISEWIQNKIFDSIWNENNHHSPKMETQNFLDTQFRVHLVSEVNEVIVVDAVGEDAEDSSKLASGTEIVRAFLGKYPGAASDAAIVDLVATRKLLVDQITADNSGKGSSAKKLCMMMKENETASDKEEEFCEQDPLAKRAMVQKTLLPDRDDERSSRGSGRVLELATDVLLLASLWALEAGTFKEQLVKTISEHLVPGDNWNQRKHDGSLQ
jgi:hypothetical protein|tara:strand:+ start:799 stop:1458 length:660 start_codon:yes stop_codon:yes gene_type:complete